MVGEAAAGFTLSISRTTEFVGIAFKAYTTMVLLRITVIHTDMAYLVYEVPVRVKASNF
jgi:hypothetical protein